jgi:signal transduction histidine kinase
MKKIRQIILCVLAGIIFCSDSVFAFPSNKQKEHHNMLSPQISISQPLLKQAVSESSGDFGRALYELYISYNRSVLFDQSGGLGMQGMVFVEMAMLAHQLANDILPVSETAISLVSLDEMKASDRKDVDVLKRTGIALKNINAFMVEILEQGTVPKVEDVIGFISRVQKLKKILPELMKIKESKRLGPELGGILDKQLSCIDEISRRVEVMLFGVKEEKFKIADCFKAELKWQAVNESVRDIAPIFGYKGGLEFVVRNMRYNVIYHSGRTVQKDYSQVKVDKGNLIMVFADQGKGFDIDVLKQKAVELGFWTVQKAEAASDQEAINLIFKKGFSLRYEKGKTHGLGLWLCSNIIRRYYKGSITAANATQGQGAVFTVTIPLKQIEKANNFDEKARTFVDVFGKSISVDEKALRSVRPATEKDAKAIALLSERLARQGVLQSEDVLNEEKIKKLLKISDHHIFLVLEVEGEAVGFTYDVLIGRRAYTKQLVIDKNHENKGYAKALYIARLIGLESKGARYIETRPTHYKMRNLVEKLGLFTYKGELLYVLDKISFHVTAKEIWENILDLAKQRVGVLKNQGFNKDPVMVELPIVRAKDLPYYLKTRLALSFDSWFRYEGEFELVHNTRISDYRLHLEWDSNELPEQLYFVLSYSKDGFINIEGYINNELSDETGDWVRAYMEIAPWNRSSDKQFRRYVGIGHQLRSFGFTKALENDPEMKQKQTFNKIRVLSNRDHAEDIFYETITPEMVNAYLKKQARWRQELIRNLGIIKMIDELPGKISEQAI